MSALDAIALTALAAAILVAIGVIVWLSRADVADAHAEGDARVAQVATEAHLEREQYEHEVTKKALAAETARANALEEQLSHELSKPFPDADHLDPADVPGRILQLAKQWGAAAGQAGAASAGTPAAAGEAVPQHIAAEQASTAAMSAITGKLP